MASFESPMLSVQVDIQHDGKYFVAKCHEFGLVAAHETEGGAWDRISRMAIAQLCFALNQDDDLSGLITNGNDEILRELRELREEKEPFGFSIQSEVGAMKIRKLETC